MKHLFPIVTILLILSFSCKDQNNHHGYSVNFIRDNNISIDGSDDEKCWSEAPLLADFCSPWESTTPLPTRFRSFYDKDNWYLFYKADEKTLLMKDLFTEEMDVAYGDRVEMFFSKDPSMKEYYCLEIDPAGHILDYKASYYRKFDNNWNIEGIKIAGKTDAGSFQIEVAIPLRTISGLGIDISHDVFAGLYRADFVKTGTDIKESWISWVDPKTPKPDFHVPASLGIFHFAGK